MARDRRTSGSSVTPSRTERASKRARIEAEADLAVRARQQTVVADLGKHALTEVDLNALLTEAVSVVAATLDVDYTKVLELLPDGEALLLKAGVGWRQGVVGRATVSAGTDSQAGYTLLTDEPVIVDDLRTETRFRGPPLLHEHEVISGLSAIIRGRERPYGVLGAHARERRSFTQDDVLFLRSVANVLAAAIERQRLEDEVREHRFQVLVQHAADVVSVVDADNMVRFVSPAVKELLGYDPAEIIGEPLGNLVHSDDRAQFQANFAAVLAAPDLQPLIEVRVRHKDGSWRWIEVRLTNRLDEPVVAGIVVNSRDITERKRAEAKQAQLLRETAAAETKVRDLIEAGPDATVVTNRDGRIMLVNRQVKALFGYESNELVGLPVEHLLPERYREAHVRYRAEYVAAPRIREMGDGRTLYGRRKDGSEFPAEIRLSPVYDNGDLLVIASVRDVTERTQAVKRQRLLAETGRKLARSLDVAATVQTAADLTVPRFADFCVVDVFDDRGHPTETSVAHVDPDRAAWFHELQRRYPVDPAESYGRARVLKTGEPELVTEVTAAALASVARDAEHLAALRDLRLSSWIIVPLIARGHTLGTISLATLETGRRFGQDDVAFAEELAGLFALGIDNARLFAAERTARTKAEALMAEHTAVLAHIADGVVAAATTGRITLVNAAARRLFGLPEVGPSGWTEDMFPALVSTDGSSRTVGELLALAGRREEALNTVAWRVTRIDETETYVTAAAIPVVNEAGERLGAVLTLHDVTLAQRLERQKDEFLANVSHDLRTPLAAIRASLGVVLANEPAGMPEALHRLLSNADLAASRMGNLVEDLLELARLQTRGDIPLRRDDVDVRQVVRRAARAIEPLVQERNQRLTVEVPLHPVVAAVDVGRLERALLNLLDNACKHGRQSGTIRLHLESRPGEVVFSVSDDGEGIAPEHQEFIFERFTRSRAAEVKSRPGSGLGLPIARALVELHGGRIWLDSVPNGGTTVWIAVPTDDADPDGKDSTA